MTEYCTSSSVQTQMLHLNGDVQKERFSFILMLRRIEIMKFARRKSKKINSRKALKKKLLAKSLILIKKFKYDITDKTVLNIIFYFLLQTEIMYTNWMWTSPRTWVQQNKGSVDQWRRLWSTMCRLRSQADYGQLNLFAKIISLVSNNLHC